MRTDLMILSFAAAVGFGLGCGDDDPAAVDGGTCECPVDPAAADVAYDNIGSGLSGTDVQDAVDELAARAEGLPDAFGRIEITEQTAAGGDGNPTATITVQCSGQAPNIGRALGGSCSGSDVGTSSVAETRLGSGGFTCIWNKELASTTEFTATVTCLAPAVAQ